MPNPSGSAEAAISAPPDTLAGALNEAGVGLSAEQVRSLIAGVAAAPADQDAEANHKNYEDSAQVDHAEVSAFDRLGMRDSLEEINMTGGVIEVEEIKDAII